MKKGNQKEISIFSYKNQIQKNALIQKIRDKANYKNKEQREKQQESLLVSDCVKCKYVYGYVVKLRRQRCLMVQVEVCSRHRPHFQLLA